MSVNRYREHLLVLPEDDAFRQIANGFLLHPEVREERVQVLPVAGGWLHVAALLFQYSAVLAKYSRAHLLAVIDCDKSANRCSSMRNDIAAEHRDRVFVLGIETEAEDLKHSLDLPFERIGRRLADGCRGHSDVWEHGLLASNAAEIQRIRSVTAGFLFDEKLPD